MNVKSVVKAPNSEHSFRFYVEPGYDLQPGDVFEYDGNRFSIDNHPTNHLNTVDGVDIIESEFNATKLYG